MLQPCEPVAPSAILERRFLRGRQFEADVVAEMRACTPMPSWSRPRTGRSGRATAEAMAGGANLVIHGRLPADPAGRRVGEPDVLVRVIGTGAYRPIDIKHHQTLEVVPERKSSLNSSLVRMGLEDAEVDPKRSTRKRRDDVLQLAHYQRMLEIAGAAAPEGQKVRVAARGGLHTAGAASSASSGS